LSLSLLILTLATLLGGMAPNDVDAPPPIVVVDGTNGGGPAGPHP
jgi:hypothetical protein